MALITEFGRRFHSINADHIDELSAIVSFADWVVTDGDELRQSQYAVFKLPSQLRGFGQISMELAHRPGVRDFLLRMGCTEW